MTVNFGGNVYDDAGNAVSGASVKLLETGTTTQEGSTVTTDSAGRWDFGEADQDRYDVEITKGSSVRRIKWSDEISLQEIDVRNNTGATTPAATFTNLTNNVANQVAVFSGANSTKADGDEIYLSFKLHDSAGNLDEFARMTVEATDVTTTTEDGQIRFGVIVGGTLTDVFTIDSSTGGAATISYEVDSFTIKGGEGEAGVLYLFADQGDDAGDEWKVNVADGGVLTIGNDIASAGTYVTFLTLTPNATTASSTVAIVGDATVGDDLSLTSDSSVFNMGAGNDFTITHDGTEGATLAGSPITVNSTGALTLDSSTDITLDADGADVFLKDGGTLFGTLTNSSGELVIKSSSSGTTAATFSGANVTFAGTIGSGAITSTGIVTGTGFTAGNAVLAEAELELLDGLTAGTAIASKVVTTDASIDTSGQRNLTISGELDAATLDISGNADIDGTTNLDAVDIDGNVQLDGTLTVGVDDTGLDVKFFGATSGKYMLWDESGDKLLVNGDTLDLNAEATLINVGVAGNDWTANQLQISSANTGGTNNLYVKNTNNSDTASHAEVRIEVGGDSGGDPVTTYIGTGYTFMVGMDNTASSQFCITRSAALGTNDSLRITTGGAITFDNSTGSDFDYVCNTCSRHSADPFVCHGEDAPWHEDMPVLMARNTPTGLQQLVNLGVYEVDGPERDQPGWTGVNLQQATHFTWSAMAQMYDEFDRRLAAIGG